MRLLGKLNFVSYIVRGARPLVSKFLQSLPAHLVRDRKQHHRRVKIFKPSLAILEKVVSWCSDTTATYGPEDNVLFQQIFVDASEYGLGFASDIQEGGYDNPPKYHHIPIDSNHKFARQAIMVKEMLAILEAVDHCSPNVNLRVVSDSQAAISTLAKDACAN